MFGKGYEHFVASGESQSLAAKLHAGLANESPPMAVQYQDAIVSCGVFLMQLYSVKLGTTPCLRLECKFWLGDHTWSGIAELSSLTLHALDFRR